MNVTQLNRVELVGTVGACRVMDLMDTRIARFSVATNYAYRSKDGCPVIETTWNSAVLFCKKGEDGILAGLGKGAKVHLIGRLRNQKVTGEDGSERTLTEIVVSSLEMIEEDGYLPCEADIDKE